MRQRVHLHPTTLDSGHPPGTMIPAPNCDLYWCPVGPPHCIVCRPLDCADRQPKTGRAGFLYHLVRGGIVLALAFVMGVACLLAGQPVGFCLLVSTIVFAIGNLFFWKGL